MYKILFVGDLNRYGRGYQRYRMLKDMGHEVTAFSHTRVSDPDFIEPPTLLFRIFWKLRIPFDTTHVNRDVIETLKSSPFDVVWIEKGNSIRPRTLRRIRQLMPSAKLISVSEDDMYAPHGHSLWYRIGLKYYDTVFTTKKYNLSELLTFGAKRTELFLDSFDENTHRPFELTEAEKTRFSCDVSAIGAYEKERAESLLFLAKNGVRVTVWGSNWGELVDADPNLDVKDEFLFGTDYSKAICASRININFLRKINRDEVTSRSVEIPACGGFMITERTQRHMEFFDEDREAVFFDDNEELLSKVKYYLAHEDERQEIAAAGRKRCLKSGYSMRDQLKNILSSLNEEEKDFRYE